MHQADDAPFAGVTVHSISGFDEHIHLTNEKGSNLYDAVRQQVLWAKAFDSIVIKQNKESKGDKAGKKDDLNPDEPMADDTNPEAEEVYLDHAVGWPVPKSKPRASSDAGGGGDGARDDDDDDDCDMDQPEEGREDENPYEEVLHNDEDAGPRDGGAVATADEEALARPRALFAGIRGTEDEAGWGEGGGRYEEGGAEAEVPEEAWVCRSQQVAESTNSDVLDGPFHYADEKVAPVGMPAPDFPSAEQPTTGLPALEMCMFVDIQQIFGKEHTIADFRNAFGDLPTKARLQLTQLQYKDAGVGQEGATSLDRFMPPARILSQYERMMIFTNALNSMEGFYMAGHYTETYLRNINYLQTNVPQPDQRVSLFSQYLLNSLRVHKSIVMNGNLRSSHAEHTMKYIEQAGKRVHKDLHKLRSMVFADCAADDLEGSTSSHIFTRDLSKQSRWQVQSPDSFVFYSWEYDEMYRHFNAKFVKLTPVNFKTFMEMNISCVMYRLGQNNPHWTRMGMLCSVMDAGGKLTTRDKSKNTKKRTGGGLDYLKWMSDILRMTYRPYLGTYEKTDKQKLVTIRRTTEGSLYDYVVFMGGKLIKVPLDVGYDVVMNEGPNDRYENVNGLFNQIDRDEDPDAAIISTCDPNNTNNRQQTTAEPVSGFKMFLLLIGKNNMLESKAETRYAQMMIPAYPCPTNHSNDQEWAIRLSRNGEADDFMDTENVDSNQLHGGGINSDSNSASRMKGNTPDEKTQKEWAPFAYFVPSVAGTAVALSNKLASWRLPINYAVKNVIDYNFSIIDQHFKCLMSTDDSRNLSRYLENLKCRMVGHTVMRKTHQMMCNSNTPEEAQLKVVQSVCQSGLHMSLVPPLLEQLLSRVVSYAPLIILSIIMPYLNIPVVSLRSVLELFNGSTVSNLREAETIKHFLISTLDNRNFMPMTETSDGGSSNNNVSPYITSKLTWSVGAVVLSGTDVTDLRHVFAQAPEKDALSFALKSISDKIFKKNSSILQDCAFIDDEMVMYSLFSSIRHCTYDMRKFFGGMKHFHDSRYMVHKMTNRTEDGMPNAFENNQRQRADPMFSIRRVSSTRLEYALGVRVWDALLFAALIQRPRRDFGVVSDFSMSIVSHLMQMLPRSIMPYNEVPALRIDAFSEQQMVYKLNARKAQQARRAENQLEVTRPEQVLRFKSNRGIKQDASFAYSSAGPTGLMEDDAFMAPIIALRDYLNIKDFTDIPLHMWCFDIAWEWGVVYPLARYDAADALPPEKFAADSKFALVLNRRCFCMQVYGQEREDLELEKSAQDQARFVPRMTLMAELKPSRKGGRDSFFQCQEDLFKMGLGPMPYIRRPGVAVRLNYGGGETRVGCIVPHQRERHGCRRPQSERCYFCAQNPFYDVMVQGAGRRGAAAARIERLYASHIGCSDKHIIKAGTPLLLRVQCIELLQVFPLSRMDAKHRNKGQGVDEGEEAETSSSNQDHNIMYYSDDDNSNEAPNGQGGDPSLPAGGEEEVGKKPACHSLVKIERHTDPPTHPRRTTTTTSWSGCRCQTPSPRRTGGWRWGSRANMEQIPRSATSCTSTRSISESQPAQRTCRMLGSLCTGSTSRRIQLHRTLLAAQYIDVCVLTRKRPPTHATPLRHSGTGAAVDQPDTDTAVDTRCCHILPQAEHSTDNKRTQNNAGGQPGE